MESVARTKNSQDIRPVANIAVIGAGWWSQGWHLPSLNYNKEANLMAIVDTSATPTSNLNPNLQTLAELKEKYTTAKIFSSVQELLNDKSICSQLDGVLIATPHATHYDVCKEVIQGEIIARQRNDNDGDKKKLHILMEKPMTTDINHALELNKLVNEKLLNDGTKFLINHSANYRDQAKLAREYISLGKLGRIRHVTAFFSSPLKWIFDDPDLKGWNEPSNGMIGNGFAWGQSSHLFAYIYHICPDLKPIDVYCSMTHSKATGADVSHSATIRCSDGNNDDEEGSGGYVVLSVSGTTLLPGNAHSDPPIAKKVQIEVFGEDGSLHYEGNDRDPSSGKLEVRKANGNIEVLHDEFLFENLDCDGPGPESLQNFVKICRGETNDVYIGANITDGVRSIQTIDAMYRSHESQQREAILHSTTS